MYCNHWSTYVSSKHLDGLFSNKKHQKQSPYCICWDFMLLTQDWISSIYLMTLLKSEPGPKQMMSHFFFWSIWHLKQNFVKEIFVAKIVRFWNPKNSHVTGLILWDFFWCYKTKWSPTVMIWTPGWLPHGSPNSYHKRRVISRANPFPSALGIVATQGLRSAQFQNDINSNEFKLKCLQH